MTLMTILVHARKPPILTGLPERNVVASGDGDLIAVVSMPGLSCSAARCFRAVRGRRRCAFSRTDG